MTLTCIVLDVSEPLTTLVLNGLVAEVLPAGISILTTVEFSSSFGSTTFMRTVKSLAGAGVDVTVIANVLPSLTVDSLTATVMPGFLAFTKVTVS